MDIYLKGGGDDKCIIFFKCKIGESKSLIWAKNFIEVICDMDADPTISVEIKALLPIFSF